MTIELRLLMNQQQQLMKQIMMIPMKLGVRQLMMEPMNQEQRLLLGQQQLNLMGLRRLLMKQQQ